MSNPNVFPSQSFPVEYWPLEYWPISIASVADVHGCADLNDELFNNVALIDGLVDNVTLSDVPSFGIVAIDVVCPN